MVSLPDYFAGVRTNSPLVTILPGGRIRLQPGASGTFFLFSRSHQASVVAFFAAPIAPANTQATERRTGSHIPELSAPSVASGLSFSIPFNDTTTYQNRYAVCVDASYDAPYSTYVLPSVPGFPTPSGLGYGDPIAGKFAIANGLLGKTLKVLVYAQTNINSDYKLLGTSNPSSPVTASDSTAQPSPVQPEP